jgi:hypothetical protein
VTFCDLIVFVIQMFLREKPELCRDMQLVPETRTETTAVTHDDHSRRSILRVPSLATTTASSFSTSRRASDASGHTFDSAPKHQEPASPRQQPPAWADQPVFVNYRPEEMIMSQQGSWPDQGGMQAGMQGSWQQQGGMMIRSSLGMPPYSPIRIRSGRGRPSFGVSNRGRRMPPRSQVQRRLPLAGRMSPPRYPSV